jgi:hypothetical protein
LTDEKKADDKADEKIVGEYASSSLSARDAHEPTALDESDIQILKTYVRIILDHLDSSKADIL